MLKVKIYSKIRSKTYLNSRKLIFQFDFKSKILILSFCAVISSKEIHNSEKKWWNHVLFISLEKGCQEIWHIHKLRPTDLYIFLFEVGSNYVEFVFLKSTYLRYKTHYSKYEVKIVCFLFYRKRMSRTMTCTKIMVTEFTNLYRFFFEVGSNFVELAFLKSACLQYKSITHSTSG